MDQVLTEKEFQLSSGLVKPEEVRRAGEYLGADLVVAGTVSRVGQTYALSAKMIDVATGKVVAQASAEKEGKIDVLLPLARQVGEQLAARGPGGAGGRSGEARRRAGPRPRPSLPSTGTRRCWEPVSPNWAPTTPSFWRRPISSACCPRSG